MLSKFRMTPAKTQRRKGFKKKNPFRTWRGGAIKSEPREGLSRAKNAKAAKKQNKFPNLAFLACLARGISESEGVK